MANMTDSIYKMRLLDELANRKTAIHQIHPLMKLLVTLAYLVVVVSFGKYEIGRLLPLVFYPAILLTLAEIPVLPMLGRMVVAAPFVIGIGIFNPLLDRAELINLFGLSISGGWVSFLSLLIKCALTVLAALLLLATTGMERIASALRTLKLPRIFVLQLLLTYRYISVLMEEAARIWNAYMLRAPGQKGIGHKAWGPLAGQLLLRTYDRGQRVYQAMGLRGFRGEYHTGHERRLSPRDMLYAVAWIVFFTLIRYIDFPALIGAGLTGVGR